MTYHYLLSCWGRDRPCGYRSLGAWISWLTITVIICAVVGRTVYVSDVKGGSTWSWVCRYLGKLRAEHGDMQRSLIKHIIVSNPSPHVQTSLVRKHTSHICNWDLYSHRCLDFFGPQYKRDLFAEPRTIWECKPFWKFRLGSTTIVRKNPVVYTDTGMTCRRRATVLHRGFKLPSCLPSSLIHNQRRLESLEIDECALHSNEGLFCGISGTLGGVRTIGELRGLFFYLLQESPVEKRQISGNQYGSHFKNSFKRFADPHRPWRVILSAIVFGYGFWKIKLSRNPRQFFIYLPLCVGGLFLYCYSLKLLMDS